MGLPEGLAPHLHPSHLLQRPVDHALRAAVPGKVAIPLSPAFLDDAFSRQGTANSAQMGSSGLDIFWDE